VDQTFCGNCGAALHGTKFCTSCGTAVAAPSPGQDGRRAGEAPPAPKASSLVNPFEGVPWTDYVRDAFAALLLFMTLGADWDARGTTGGDHWYVTLAVLASLGSLAVPYLLAAKALPGVGPHESQLLKAALNLPLMAAMLVAVIVAAANVQDDFDGYFGPAIAFGLAGSMLSLQPRKVEEGSTYAWWRRAPFAVGLFAFAGLLAGHTFWLVKDLVDARSLDGDLLLAYASVLAGGLMVVLLLLGVPWLALRRNTFASNRLYVVLGTCYLGAMAVTLMGNDGGFLYPQCPEKLVPVSALDESLVLASCGTLQSVTSNYPLGAFILLVPVSAVLALSRPVLGSIPGSEQVADWLAIAAKTLVLFGLVSAAYIVHLTLELVVSVRNDETPSSLIVRIVVLLVALVLALVTRALLGSPARNRLTVVALAGVLSVLALVNAIVGHESIGVQYSSLGLVFGFVLPSLVVYALVGPSEVRREFGSLLPAPTTAPGPEVPESPGANPEVDRAE
jgi:hypothetical protein